MPWFSFGGPLLTKMAPILRIADKNVLNKPLQNRREGVKKPLFINNLCPVRFGSSSLARFL
jgi:hypothetical protein